MRLSGAAAQWMVVTLAFEEIDLNQQNKTINDNIIDILSWWKLKDATTSTCSKY